jgi:cytochrome c oxidase assembly protein subunit 15
LILKLPVRIFAQIFRGFIKSKFRLNKARFFRRFGIVTIFSIYLLILVGGIVRSTGSGMGCPDWPKCFGQYIPPTDVSELPADYQDIYAEKRAKKNQKVANYIEKLGFVEVANKIRTDKSILEEAEFNATKTWIEYLNRLLGALIGIFVFGTFLFSLTYWKKDRKIVSLSFLSVLLVGFQGWIGSIVVSTNLLSGMVSIHMIIALLIVALLIYVIARSYKFVEVFEQVKSRKTINILLLAGIVLFISQLIMGTQVREAVDAVFVKYGGTERGKWIEELGMIFYIHRSYSLLILALHVFLWYKLKQNIQSDTRLRFWNQALLACIVLEIATGAMMAYFAIPAFIQPIHLLFANLIFGVQFSLLIMLNFGWFFGAENARTYKTYQQNMKELR